MGTPGQSFRPEVKAKIGGRLGILARALEIVTFLSSDLKFQVNKLGVLCSSRTSPSPCASAFVSWPSFTYTFRYRNTFARILSVKRTRPR